MSQFLSQKFEKYILVKCPQKLDIMAAADFSDQSKSWMLDQVNSIVLDFSGVLRVEREFYQAFIFLKTNLKRDQKVAYSLNLSPALIKQIKEDGVELAFNPIHSINEIASQEKSSAPESNTISVNFINPFLTATLKTLEVQCNTKAKVLKPFAKKEQIPNIAIIGVLTLLSNGSAGSIALCFSEATFLSLYDGMFGEKHNKITPDLEDAAAELLNIIYGMAKIELNAKGFNFQKALPTVLTGEKIGIRQSGSTPAVIIPFEIEAGQLHLEIETIKQVGGSHV